MKFGSSRSGSTRSKASENRAVPLRPNRILTSGEHLPDTVERGLYGCVSRHPRMPCFGIRTNIAIPRKRRHAGTEDPTPSASSTFARDGRGLYCLVGRARGTSYAAIKLPANSVGTKQLRKNAVTSVKVKDNAVKGADVLESSLGRVSLARNASNADKATTATSAANADKLDGLDSLDLLPGGTLPSGKTIRETGSSAAPRQAPAKPFTVRFPSSTRSPLHPQRPTFPAAPATRRPDPHVGEREQPAGRSRPPLRLRARAHQCRPSQRESAWRPRRICQCPRHRHLSHGHSWWRNPRGRNVGGDRAVGRPSPVGAFFCREENS